MSKFLEIISASKNYGNIRALDDVNIEIKENEFFALLGPSGCGKTTLLRALAGFESLDSGNIILDTVDLLPIPANKRPVNLMFQSYALFPHMNVFDNVAYGLRREKLSEQDVKIRVSEILNTVALSNHSERMPRQLSGGQKQRVALARAIVKRPKVLLLDEPLSALDKKVRSEMQLELKRLQHEAGITFIIVTHDQEEAMSIADRIALMNEGKVVQVSTPINMYREPNSKFVADFIGTNNIFEGVLLAEGLKVKEKILPIPSNTNALGSSACLVVRPESMRIANDGYISGKVINSNYYGDTSIVFVDCGLAGLVKISCSFNLVPELGSECSLVWNTEDSLLIKNV